jgi:carboxypeptidase Q
LTQRHAPIALTLVLVTLLLGACLSPLPPKSHPSTPATKEPAGAAEKPRPTTKPVAGRPTIARAPASEAAPNPLASYQTSVDKIFAATEGSGRSYDRLRHLCDVIGPRLSGSEGLVRAVDWTAATMSSYGLRVEKQRVMVPHWVRGDESAHLITPRETELAMLGLGNSVGTPEGGITAEVVVVSDFDELTALGAGVKGKIVLFDAAMPEYDAERGAGYGQTVAYRTAGASRAGAAGALACLVRSVTAKSLSTPHTGMLRYEKDKPEIPAAAVSIENAMLIRRLIEAGETVTVRLEMDAHFEEDAPSANVIADLVGTELPDEIVIISGHLDSWDVGQGAHDDGGACMAVMEALHTLSELGLRPRRTIRAVLWTNEENGLRGSREYINANAESIPRYQAAIEADSGVFQPLGFGVPAVTDEQTGRTRARLDHVAALLAKHGVGRLRPGGGGADIGAMKAFGVPLLGLQVEGSRYFDYHHTHADTLDKVDPDEIDRCSATLAAMAYVLADMPDRLAE